MRPVQLCGVRYSRIRVNSYFLEKKKFREKVSGWRTVRSNRLQSLLNRNFSSPQPNRIFWQIYLGKKQDFVFLFQTVNFSGLWFVVTVRWHGIGMAYSKYWNIGKRSVDICEGEVIGNFRIHQKTNSSSKSWEDEQKNGENEGE